MKWIGAHIWDWVTRFRNDVYLDSVADGTVVSDKFLGLVSSGKVGKAVGGSGGGSGSGEIIDLGDRTSGNEILDIGQRV